MPAAHRVVGLQLQGEIQHGFDFFLAEILQADKISSFQSFCDHVYTPFRYMVCTANIIEPGLAQTKGPADLTAHE